MNTCRFLWVSVSMAVVSGLLFQSSAVFATPDAPLFVVTGDNSAAHAEHLSDGHRILLGRYPQFRMPVFPTTSPVTVPPAFLAATEANAGVVRSDGVEGIDPLVNGTPFPEPSNGIEVLWNHRLRWRGGSRAHQFIQAEVLPDGAFQRIIIDEWRWDDRESGEDRSTFLLKTVWDTQYPDGVPYGAGSNAGAMWYDPWNFDATESRFWMFSPRGKARTFPFSGDETSLMAGKNIRYFDMVDLLRPPLDRFTYKLIGTTNMIVPFDSWRLNNGEQTTQRLLQPQVPSTEDFAYQMRAVWIVDATLRDGETYPTSRRTFYVDAETWSILLAEHYDPDGKLWRLHECHLLALGPQRGSDCRPQFIYALDDERYVVTQLMADGLKLEFESVREAQFSPNSAARKVAR